jgi:secretory lipase
VQSPWISALTIFVGVVVVTYPSTLVTTFTLFAGLWAIILGIASLARWLWVGMREDRPFTTVRDWSTLKRVLAIGIPLVLLGALILGYGVFQSNAASATAYQTSLDSFYQITSGLAPGDPGSIVRIAPYSPPGLHGRAWRILFRSQDQYGRPTVSSGAVYAPASEGKDRLIVGWAHGTVGLGPQCAPSRQATDPAIFPWVNDMLDHGWVVAAPDYVGAGGTAGTGIGEKYLIGAEQGRDLLNGVRAARNIPETGAGSRFATYGHSQGGLVSLSGAALAHSYAPELTLIADGAVSAASDIGALLRVNARWNSPLIGWILGPGLVYPWVRYYPNLDAASILTSAALNHYQEIAASGCLLDVLPAIVNPQMGAFFSKDPTSDPPWRKAMIANQAPLPPDGVPVFIGHGLADTLIDPSLSTGLVSRYCDKGANVTTEWIPGVGHGEAAIDAAPHYIQWLADIADGKSPAPDCDKPLPVPPAQPLA